MNTLKLENVLLRFIHTQQLNQKLINGIISKVSQMMYKHHIDYYYADSIATATATNIKFVDNIYIKGYKNLNNKTLPVLLKECGIYEGTLSEANQLEHDVYEILKTKRPINTRKVKYKKH